MSELKQIQLSESESSQFMEMDKRHKLEMEEIQLKVSQVEDAQGNEKHKFWEKVRESHGLQNAIIHPIENVVWCLSNASESEEWEFNKIILGKR